MKIKEHNNSQLHDRKQSLEVYNDRYDQGYMDDFWDTDHKRKIFKVIQDLQLPNQGEALDFGCGNGDLTEVVRQALLGWKVYGTDVSKKAVDKARIRHSDCTFFELHDPSFKQKQFDFIFTNHVFEHVYSLSEVFSQMTNYLKLKSSMLHFLPCGNEGSYEYNVCLLRKDGINRERENRFFFEEKGHVRRLTTEEFCELCESQNFELQKEYYSNQYYGAINWITNSIKFVIMFSDSSNAINTEAKKKLKKIRRQLILITIIRQPAKIVNSILKKNKQLKHHILLLMVIPFYIFSNPIDKYWIRKAKEEWDTKKFERNGSEMGLYFKRG